MAGNTGAQASAAGVTVSVAEAGPVLAEALTRAGTERLATRLSDADATLWGPDAESEASIRLGWLDLPTSSRALLPRLAELRLEVAAAGLDHVVLAGMGGSSLAPEVITRSWAAQRGQENPLTVLDTTDAGQIRHALADRLPRTVVVIASKSGGTIETDSHRRAYAQAFADAGLSAEQIAERMVVVTDPGSPLEATARAAGYRVVLADPHVGGRYSALTAFGLVPSALAGVDVAALLDEASALAPELASNEPTNPGLLLGLALGTGAATGRDKAVIATAGDPPIVGFGDWAEQLVAESTGKQGRGILPVVVESVNAPGFAEGTFGHDARRVVLGGAADGDITVSGPLGAQFLLWEFATAVVGWVLDINPFDQPNVQESKDNTGALLDKAGEGPLPEGEPLFTEGAVRVYGEAQTLGGATDLAGALSALLALVPDGGYLAVMAYLDRFADAAADQLRPALAARLGRQVTFGWGPRFLHSTGQYHKGGPARNAFLQITGDVVADLPVPGRPYTFARLQLAQALGDLGALAARGRPTLRLHLTDRQGGLRQVLTAVEAAS